MLRIGVTGVNGNIGKVLIQRGATPLDVDVREYEDVRKVIRKASPDIIIHTASKSKPDWCETLDNTNEAIDVNYNGAINVALVAKQLDIPVVALSTDHVFFGEFYQILGVWDFVFGGPYSEKNLKPYPANFYGQTKLAMEYSMDVFDHVKIIRTSNCFWRDDPRAMWYINQLQEQNEVPVPVFQRRSFMHRIHFVENLEIYCRQFRRMPKILHISGSKTVTWFEFIREFARAIGISESDIKRFTKKRRDDNRQAKRPKKAGLKVGLSKKLGLPQYSYKDGLEIL